MRSRTFQDAQGVRRSGSPLAYGCVLAFCNGLLWTAWQWRRGLQLRSLLPGWPRTLAISMSATLSYWLILWVWTRAPEIRPTSRANASAARRTTGNSQFGSMRQKTWIPRFPDVFGQPV